MGISLGKLLLILSVSAFMIPINGASDYKIQQNY